MQISIRTRHWGFHFALVAIVVAGFPAGSRAAGIVKDFGGFEAYAAADIVGQFGWDSVPDPGSATVQSSFVKSGANAVQVNRMGFSDKRWGSPATGFPTGRFVLVEWDMRVQQTVGPTGTFGPFMAIEAWDYTGPQTGILGSLGVDASTGDILFQQQVTGNLTESGAQVTFNDWHNFQILVDFNLHKYTTFVEGELIASVGFVDGGTSLNQFTVASIAAVAAAPDSGSQGLTATAYIDNLIVRDGIPGDFNQNGAVNGADFATWKAAFGAGSAADSDGDGDSDGADFLTWQRETSIDLLAATPAASVVPEPASAIVYGLAALSLRGLRIRGLRGRRAAH